MMAFLIQNHERPVPAIKDRMTGALRYPTQFPDWVIVPFDEPLQAGDVFVSEGSLIVPYTTPDRGDRVSAKELAKGMTAGEAVGFNNGLTPGEWAVYRLAARDEWLPIEDPDDKVQIGDLFIHFRSDNRTLKEVVEDPGTFVYPWAGAITSSGTIVRKHSVAGNPISHYLLSYRIYRNPSRSSGLDITAALASRPRLAGNPHHAAPFPNLSLSSPQPSAPFPSCHSYPASGTPSILLLTSIAISLILALTPRD